MNLASMALLALAMSTDAFAAAVGKGVALERPHWREALRTGLIFGTIEALTPLAGWLLGTAVASHVAAWDHWIAFVLLGGLGVRMVFAGLQADADDDTPTTRPQRHGFVLLAITGFATSIDAMVVGLGLAMVDVDIVKVALAIGFTTMVMVTAGVMLGRVLGQVAGRRAEVLGGIVLIGVGAAILREHLAA